MKWGSRKFILTVVQTLIVLVLPIVYKKLEIGDDVLMLVLGASSSLVALYSGMNVLEKKKANNFNI
jgi:hypothetical protein